MKKKISNESQYNIWGKNWKIFRNFINQAIRLRSIQIQIQTIWHARYIIATCLIGTFTFTSLSREKEKSNQRKREIHCTNNETVKIRCWSVVRKNFQQNVENSCTCAPISPINTVFDIHYSGTILYIHRITSTCLSNKTPKQHFYIVHSLVVCEQHSLLYYVHSIALFAVSMLCETFHMVHSQ